MSKFDERHVANYLNLNPSNPLYWPVDLLRRLLGMRDQYGHEAFQWEVYRLLKSW